MVDGGVPTAAEQSEPLPPQPEPQLLLHAPRGRVRAGLLHTRRCCIRRVRTAESSCCPGANRLPSGSVGLSVCRSVQRQAMRWEPVSSRGSPAQRRAKPPVGAGTGTSAVRQKSCSTIKAPAQAHSSTSATHPAHRNHRIIAPPHP